MNETKQNDGLTPLMPYSIPNENSETDWLRHTMRHARRMLNSVKLGLVGIVLGCLVIAGCTKTITIKPECNVPQLAPLPVIMSDDMDCLADNVYWGLMDRERLLTDWALEMEATLEVICEN
jgi:hypothetical protein